MCEYRLRAVEGLSVHAIETSVVWIAGGKGSEDIGVHYFQRISKDAISPSMLQRPHRLSTVLPNSPLTYPGLIINICWCVRVRMFYGDELQLNQDLEFLLGDAEVPEAPGSRCTDDTLDGGSLEGEPLDEAPHRETSISDAPAHAPRPR